MTQALVYPHDVASSVDGSVVYVVEISPNIILKMSSKRQVGWYLSIIQCSFRFFKKFFLTTPLNIVSVKTGERVVIQGCHSILGKSMDEFSPQ